MKKKILYNSPLILTYALVSLAALGLDKLTGGWVNAHLFSVYRSSPSDPLSYFRLFGHVIGHVSLTHYVNNFMMILLLGPALEEKYGSRNLLFFFLATALVTALVHLATSSAALLGASGIVFMSIVLFACASIRSGGVPLTLILILVLYLGEQVVTGVTVRDQIGQLVHIVGGVMGLLLGVFVAPHRR